jgi:hypothetical protein
MSERDDQGGGEVLRSLPATRPQRRSARRDGKPAAKRPAAKPKVAAAKSKPASPARKRPTGTTRPKGVRPSEATRAASSTPGERPAHPPEGAELVGTAIQAAGELAQLGLTLGTKALRAAVKRIPRP